MLEQVLKVKNIFFTLAFLSDVCTKMALQNFVAKKKKEKNRTTKMIKNRMAKKKNTYKEKYGQETKREDQKRETKRNKGQK
jgi:hypothetical protein